MACVLILVSRKRDSESGWFAGGGVVGLVLRGRRGVAEYSLICHVPESGRWGGTATLCPWGDGTGSMAAMVANQHACNSAHIASLFTLVSASGWRNRSRSRRTSFVVARTKCSAGGRLFSDASIAAQLGFIFSLRCSPFMALLFTAASLNDVWSYALEARSSSVDSRRFFSQQANVGCLIK